jgi:hypothetical protein
MKYDLLIINLLFSSIIYMIARPFKFCYISLAIYHTPWLNNWRQSQLIILLVFKSTKQTRALSKISHFFRLVCWNVSVYSSRKIPRLKGKIKLFQPELSSRQRGVTSWWSNMLGIGRLLVLLCCCVRRLCLSVSMDVNQSLLSACFLECIGICLKLFHPELSSRQRRLTFWWSNMLWIGRLLNFFPPLFVSWNMYPFVQNNAGKKLFHPELSSGQRGLTFRWSNMLGIGRLLALLCCSVCVRASLSLCLCLSRFCACGRPLLL